MGRSWRTRWASRQRRVGTVGSVAVVVLLVSATAYAWVSAGPGAGNGAVTTGAPLEKISVNGPTEIDLRIDEPRPLSGSFVNDNTFTVSVARVEITVTGITGSGTCDIQPGVNFITTDAVPPAGQRFTVKGASTVTGSGLGNWSGGMIEFRSSPTFDQNGCLDRKIILKYMAIAA